MKCKGRGWIRAGVAALAATLVSFHPVMADSFDQARKLYIEHCSACHHPKRLGLTAPPLIPQLFSRSVRGKIDDVIREGLPATKMPAFKDKLTAERIELLARYIQSPIDDRELVWTDQDIRDSLECFVEGSAGSFEAGNVDDLENVTLVMERGTKSLVLLQGPDLEEKARFFVGAVHGGPKFSYSLKDVYSVSRDGRVTRFNIPRLATDCVLKAGINSRSIAVSYDDQIVAVANYLPSNIVFLNSASLKPVHKIELPGKAGGFYSAPSLKGFILSFREIPELWIIRPGDTYNIEKILLPAPFEDFSMSPVNSYILGTKRGGDRLYIYDYKLKRVAAELPTSGMPHLASAAFWINNGEMYAGVNHIKKPFATIISLADKKIAAKIPLPGAGFFVRTHASTRFLWIDTETDRIALVDKSNFKDLRYLTPSKGRKAMHVEFTKHGRYALVTVPGEDGEVVVYDAVSLAKVKTIPFRRPAGKYNALNKTYPEKALETAARPPFASPGKHVFDNFCMGCHHQIYEAFGPSFSEIAETRSEGEIREHIKSPGESANSLGYDRSSMSYVKLTKPQLDAIVSYILSFKQDN